MANITGSNQSPLITQRYLNTSTYAGDPTPGALVSTSQVSGSIVQPYTGMLGGILTLSEGGANYYTDTVNGQQLYAGDYQYVQFYASSSATAAQGCVVFWQNLLNGNFIVTPDAASTNTGLVAGIALCATGKGNYWWIQTRGIAQVKFKASIANGAPAIGDIVIVDTTPSNLADDPTSQTAITKTFLGNAWGAAPASSTISPVALAAFAIKYYPGG